MSKRLQVILSDAEYRAVARAARAHRTSVSAWVRDALREARAKQPSRDAVDKLRVVRAAALHDFPIGPIEQVLEEIERGYAGTVG